MEWLTKILTDNGIENADNIIGVVKKELPLHFVAKTDFEALQFKYGTDTKKLAEDMKEQRLNSAIRLNLKDKVHDESLVMGLFDKSKIELNEDGTIKLGFKEQLEGLQKNKSFLFVPEKIQEPPKVKGATPYESNADQKRDKPDADPSIAIAKQVAQNATSKEAASANDYYFKKF